MLRRRKPDSARTKNKKNATHQTGAVATTWARLLDRRLGNQAGADDGTLADMAASGRKSHQSAILPTRIRQDKRATGRDFRVVRAK